MSDVLKIVVERAVRPLAAPQAVKRRMREDLYALICDIHREESARGHDAGALERTLARFGPPEQLTRDLQQSLSWHERSEYWLNHWVERRPNESPLGLALRVTLVMSAGVRRAPHLGHDRRRHDGVHGRGSASRSVGVSLCG